MDLARSPARPRAAAADGSRVAGLAFVALPTLFLTALMLGASSASGYDVRDGAISDLGVLPQTSLLFNATLVLVGVLDLAGGWALSRLLGGPALLAVFVVASVGAIGAGLMPLDSAGPHGLFALVAFVAFNLQPLVVARHVRGPIRGLAIVASIVGLAFVALMVIGDAGNPAAFGPIGHGGAERMIVYPAMLWTLAFGGWLLGSEPGPTIRSEREAR